jgi:hypothetical protein
VSAVAAKADEHARVEQWMEVVSTVLLSLATVATAWASYQAAQWHGEQAEMQAKANATRLESTRASGLANRQIQIDVAIFSQWIDARARGDTQLARFYRQRFRDRFKPAFRAWLATNPFQNPRAPQTPFALPQYSLAASAQAERLEAKASALSDQGVRDIQRADDYVLCVVLFAASLFFAGLSTKLRPRAARATVLGLGCVLFLGTLIWLATFPVSSAI